MMQPLQPTATPPDALVYPGHDTPRPLVLDAARLFLAGKAHHLQVGDALADRPGLVVAAWWAGDRVGFCQPDHPDATPVTVVNLPSGYTDTTPAPAVTPRSGADRHDDSAGERRVV